MKVQRTLNQKPKNEQVGHYYYITMWWSVTCVITGVFQCFCVRFGFQSAHVDSQLERRRDINGVKLRIYFCCISGTDSTTELYSSEDLEKILRNSEFSKLPATLRSSADTEALISSQTAVIVWLRHSGKWTDSVPVQIFICGSARTHPGRRHFSSLINRPVSSTWFRSAEVFPSGRLRCAGSPKYFGTGRTIGMVTASPSVHSLICLQYKLQADLNSNRSRACRHHGHLPSLFDLRTKRGKQNTSIMNSIWDNAIHPSRGGARSISLGGGHRVRSWLT